MLTSHRHDQSSLKTKKECWREKPRKKNLNGTSLTVRTRFSQTGSSAILDSVDFDFDHWVLLHDVAGEVRQRRFLLVIFVEDRRVGPAHVGKRRRTGATARSRKSR